MKLPLLLFLVVEAVSLVPNLFIFETVPLVANQLRSLQSEWILFKKSHKKEYTRSENIKRKKRYSLVRQWISSHNEGYRKGKKTYRLGINQFTDMTIEEARKSRNGLLRGYTVLKNVQRNKRILLPFTGLTKSLSIPGSVDWRKTLGDWPPIKDQRSCGSCWAYSAIGVMEYQLAKMGMKINLSEQQLIDCSRNYGNTGCEGGLMTKAFNYILANGISSAAVYPESFNESICYSNVSSKFGIVGYRVMDNTSEEKLMAAIATYGPICVAIDASQPSMFAYEGGVYCDDYCNSSAISHGLIVVGYGTEEDLNYWLLRNSWGKDWGEGGYMKILRENNHCGILTMVSYPFLKL